MRLSSEMTKKNVKAIFGEPTRSVPYALFYPDGLQFYFKYDGHLYLAVVNADDDSAPVVVLYDRSLGSPLNFVLATVL